MKSKIIKVSIILIFMLFSAGLFNFCFALTLGTDFEITNTITMPKSKEMHWVKSNVTYDLPNENNVQAYNENVVFDINELLNCYNNNGYIYTFYRWSSAGEYRLQLDIPHESNAVISYSYYDDSACFRSTKYGDETYSNVPFYKLYYDFATNTWYVHKSNNTTFGLGLAHYQYYLDSSLPIYDGLWDTGNIIYESIKQPTNEDLITNCDFKVNFKFAPKSEDFPSDNVGSRWSWFCRLLVQHSMTNWDENYNVKVNLSVVNKTEPNGLYYDLYNSNGEEIQKKKHIKEGILSEDVNNGDFLLMFTDNLQDTFKLEYEIYNKSDELLMRKIYTFKFTKSGLTAYNSTGTIISEQTQDSTGQDIESNENSFNTNGYDNTSNNNNDNDYYDVSNLNNLISSANETVNLTQKCFAILPGFIWAMVGIFLTVCIALRILGR